MNQTATEERSWQTFPESPVAIYIAGFATGISLVVSSITVNRHLVHWSKPRTQGQIIRIVLVCPIYALASLLSLVVSEAASVYVETVRDLFEAFVIYTFLALVLEYAGGEAACVAKICHLPPLRHPLGPCLARLLPAMPRNHVLLRKCKQGTLQFVLVKPLMAFTGLIAALAGATEQRQLNRALQELLGRKGLLEGGNVALVVQARDEGGPAREEEKTRASLLFPLLPPSPARPPAATPLALRI